MSPTTHVIAGYVVTILLLWGYAVTLWLSARRQRSHNQDNPGTTRELSGEGSDLS